MLAWLLAWYFIPYMVEGHLSANQYIHQNVIMLTIACECAILVLTICHLTLFSKIPIVFKSFVNTFQYTYIVPVLKYTIKVERCAKLNVCIFKSTTKVFLWTGPPAEFGGLGHAQEMGPLTMYVGLLCQGQSAYIMLILKGTSNVYILPQQNTIHYNLWQKKL